MSLLNSAVDGGAGVIAGFAGVESIGAAGGVIRNAGGIARAGAAGVQLILTVGEGDGQSDRGESQGDKSR